MTEKEYPILMYKYQTIQGEVMDYDLERIALVDDKEHEQELLAEGFVYDRLDKEMS